MPNFQGLHLCCIPTVLKTYMKLKRSWKWMIKTNNPHDSMYCTDKTPNHLSFLCITSSLNALSFAITAHLWNTTDTQTFPKTWGETNQWGKRHAQPLPSKNQAVALLLFTSCFENNTATSFYQHHCLSLCANMHMCVCVCACACEWLCVYARSCAWERCTHTVPPYFQSIVHFVFERKQTNYNKPPPLLSCY